MKISQKTVDDLRITDRHVFTPDGWFTAVSNPQGCGACDLRCPDPVFGWHPCDGYREQYNIVGPCVFKRGL